jgi:hypothetical protein
MEVLFAYKFTLLKGICMSTIRRFEDIKAWQKARELTKEIYKMCGATSISKDYGFRDQICRAAVSSMSNIAEGFARKRTKTLLTSLICQGVPFLKSSRYSM